MSKIFQNLPWREHISIHISQPLMKDNFIIWLRGEPCFKGLAKSHRVHLLATSSRYPPKKWKKGYCKVSLLMLEMERTQELVFFEGCTLPKTHISPKKSSFSRWFSKLPKVGYVSSPDMYLNFLSNLGAVRRLPRSYLCRYLLLLPLSPFNL